MAQRILLWEGQEMWFDTKMQVSMAKKCRYNMFKEFFRGL